MKTPINATPINTKGFLMTSPPPEEIAHLIIGGLTTDGAHHKQWYLEQIAKALGVNINGLDYEKGMAP